MTDHKMKALLIGIDAGCLPVFDRLIEDDVIPNIQSICENGAVGPLSSQIPPWTPSAWPSMYTGVNPGKHGTFGFVDYDGYDWHVVSADHVREHAMWTLLEEHDLSSVVVNVPVTHPPDEIDGAIIPGFIGPEHPDSHPTGILEDVMDEIGEYRVYPKYERDDQEWTDSEKMDEYTSLVRMHGEAFRYLEGEFEPDFGFVQFQKTDTVFHEFLGDWEKVKQVYAETDRQVGKLLEECDAEQVFLASDHGMGPYDKQEFRVNEFLHDEGYVETTQGGKGMPSWNPIRSQLREGENEETWEPNIFERFAATIAKHGFTASRVGKSLRSIGLDSLIKPYVPDNVARTASEQVDFPASTAYMRARVELGVRINLKGREPEGVVPKSEYEDVRSELIDLLKGVQTPEGEPMFETVAPREEYYNGEFTESAVDIVTVPKDFEYFISAQLLGEQFGPPTEPWNHKLDGVFAAMGEGIDETASLEDAHLYDVAPTIMAAMGIQYSDRMDGRVLPVVDDIGATSYPEYGDELERNVSDEEVESRLADLGYL
ncbi:alkaline phosphatase family protein [Halocatena halophila]|uniref:alkaline phosphatase family protein n=1 Tax=Halocatena halophila TaxID=2814576 RepID=UPI002ED0E305